MDTHEIDWDALRSKAQAMTDRSYAPYSGVRVGAAALCDDGSIVSGCNVENASIGLSICAEINLCGHLVAARSPGQTRSPGKDSPKPIALAVVAGDHRPIPPCGRCRQFLYEFGGADLLIEIEDRVVTLGELLPEAFGPDDVAERAG